MLIVGSSFLIILMLTGATFLSSKVILKNDENATIIKRHSYQSLASFILILITTGSIITVISKSPSFRLADPENS